MRAIKNWVVNLIWLVLFVLFASGCSAINVATGYVVNEYCDTELPARMVVRHAVNTAAAPHSVRIDCEGDEAFFTDSQSGSE